MCRRAQFILLRIAGTESIQAQFAARENQIGGRTAHHGLVTPIGKVYGGIDRGQDETVRRLPGAASPGGLRPTSIR